MTDNLKKLDQLRKEIDRIDDTIHDLIMERTEIVKGVRAAKQDGAVMIRPSREAEIFYRLMARHKGPFPKRELCRIWRELIVATLSFEGPFSVSVYMPEGVNGYWDLARDQYGTFSKLNRHGNLGSVVEAVKDGTSTLGILPLPSRDDSDNWWRFLLSDLPGTPKIIARQPFIPGSNARDDGLEALVVSPVEQQQTGRDRSFLAFESEYDVGFTALDQVLSSHGFSSVFNELWHDPNRPAAWTYLIEVMGFVDYQGAQLSALTRSLEGKVLRVIHLGGYATPLSESELSS